MQTCLCVHIHYVHSSHSVHIHYVQTRPTFFVFCITLLRSLSRSFLSNLKKPPTNLTDNQLFLYYFTYRSAVLAEIEVLRQKLIEAARRKAERRER